MLNDTRNESASIEDLDKDTESQSTEKLLKPAENLS
jgi:hypothetical protein